MYDRMSRVVALIRVQNSWKNEVFSVNEKQEKKKPNGIILLKNSDNKGDILDCRGCISEW
jgi:hypothetical protein